MKKLLACALICILSLLTNITSFADETANNYSNSLYNEQEFMYFYGGSDEYILIGENNEYVFAVVYPWNNTPKYIEIRNGLNSQGYYTSGLYTNDEQKNPIYQLPELEKRYDIEVSSDGKEVWFIAEQCINLCVDRNKDGTVPIISYYNNGKCVYNILLTDLYKEDDFINFPGDEAGNMWYDMLHSTDSYFEIYMMTPTEENPFNSKLIKVDRYTGETLGYDNEPSFPSMIVVIVIAIIVSSVVVLMIIISRKFKQRNQDSE